jgi:hypothetical protein
VLDDDDAADPGPYPCMYAIYALITRRVTGQSFVCRMVYIWYGFYMGTLISRNTTQMAFCSSRNTTQMANCSSRNTT